MEALPVFVSLRSNFYERSSSRQVSGCTRLTLLFVLIFNLSRCSSALRVIGGNITEVQGETVVLPCKLIDTTETLTQISWQRMTRGKPQNDNFYTITSQNGPQFVNGRDDRFQIIGNFSDKNGSIQLSNVTLLDEGVYTCIFTLFPSGNHETKIPLNLLVPPVTSLSHNHAVLGNEEVSLATCTAAGSRPPAEVRWLTGTLAEKVRATDSSTQHSNGTTTTVSSLFGVPTKEINQHVVQCVVTNPALSKEETMSFTIQVYFSPMGVYIGEKSKDSFRCVTEANPSANFTWRRPGHSFPQPGVRVEGATLQFLSMSSDLNGLYQCEASNLYGKDSGYLYVHMTSGACSACWALFSLLLIAIVAAAAVWYLYKSGKLTRMPGGTREEMQKVRKTSSGSEEPQRVEEEVEEEADETAVAVQETQRSR
ncbi:nectin-1 isoform X2 [Lates calcarifer]|uniref:Nectin-1 isoform X2 n=1 Tax=Lates calcarifer TaxID=8187 RepID=A0AAJ7LWB7_LATCA|nr:nectin-1 isoform X2 [Lates calcarifer]